jgi:hypothetical protein
MIQIELRNIRVNKALSNETPCYSADLYVDGKLAARVGNRGHGGCDEFMDVNAPPNSADNYKAIEARVKADYPPLDMSAYGMDPLPASLETVCQGLVEDHLARQAMALAMRRKVAFFKDGLPPEGQKAPLFTSKLRPADTVASLIEVLRTYHPKAYFLNTLTPEEQWEAYQRVS